MSNFGFFENLLTPRANESIQKNQNSCASDELLEREDDKDEIEEGGLTYCSML